MKYSYLLGSMIITCGLLGFGYFSSKHMKLDSQLIEVKGLSEKTVRSDICNMCIGITNNNDNLEKLYKKRVSDKEKVMTFLKSHGVSDEEIINYAINTTECEEDYKNNSTVAKKYKYFKAEDKLCIRTKDLEKIQKIKEEIVKLSSEGVLITYNYAYRLTNFSDIKIKMMKDASENARKNAEAFIEPQGRRIGKVVYLRQGEITVRGEDEGEEVYSWDSKESTSINKKLRLVVRAGFMKSRRHLKIL